MEILPGFNAIDGWRVVECGSYTQKVKRTLRNRFFSRTWQPLRKYDEFQLPLVKDGETILMRQERIIICNAKTKKELIDYAKKESEFG